MILNDELGRVWRKLSWHTWISLLYPGIEENHDCLLVIFLSSRIKQGHPGRLL
jgi:hypothetical protein